MKEYIKPEVELVEFAAEAIMGVVDGDTDVEELGPSQNVGRG